MELLPNSMSFRVINTIDITDDNEIPVEFTGRVRRSFDSSQRYVAWYTGGHLDDPTKGYPAYRVHRADGQVKYEMHYRDGLLDDPDDRTPAVRGYYAGGGVHYEERYCAGRRCGTTDRCIRTNGGRLERLSADRIAVDGRR